MSTAAHKHVGDEGKPGQIINTDMMDDMGQYADGGRLTRRGNPVEPTTSTVPEPAKRVTWETINGVSILVVREHIHGLRHHALILKEMGYDPKAFL